MRVPWGWHILDTGSRRAGRERKWSVRVHGTLGCPTANADKGVGVWHGGGWQEIRRNGCGQSHGAEHDGGATWTAGSQLAGSMKLSWLPNSNQGWMVADYVMVSYANGNPFGVFAVAQAPTTGGVLHESIYTTKNPLPISYSAPRFSSSGEQPVPGFKSDHKMQFFYDDEGTRPIPRSRWLRNPQ